MLRFPDGFVWGVATASYQIEGAVAEGGRGPSIWDTFAHTPGKVQGGDTGDVACDHYHRWQHDIALMRELGVGAYRFSIAWPRIFPEGIGSVNREGLGFYDRLVDGLLDAGITPFATLYHWDLPQAMDAAGGWLTRHTALAMADYATAVADRLGDRVLDWMTINEPWVISHHGHITGEHAPGHRDRSEAWPVAHHLLLAHGLATEAVRAVVPGARIGIVLNLQPQHPASAHPGDVSAARIADGTWNRWFLDPVSGRGYPDDAVAAVGWDQAEVRGGDMETVATPVDFLGVNYYSRTIVRSEEVAERDRPGPTLRPGEETTAMGWEVYPEGLDEVLSRVHEEYAFPAVYVTENGAAYPDRLVDGAVDDPARISYFRRHLAQVHRAVAAGVPVHGYFAWSLMDNFEWAHGYSKRFGLCYVDYPTQQRIVKASGRWYAAVAAGNGLGAPT